MRNAAKARNAAQKPALTKTRAERIYLELIGIEATVQTACLAIRGNGSVLDAVEIVLQRQAIQPIRLMIEELKGVTR
jgi:hypothetical protein